MDQYLYTESLIKYFDQLIDLLKKMEKEANKYTNDVDYINKGYLPNALRIVQKVAEVVKLFRDAGYHRYGHELSSKGRYAVLSGKGGQCDATITMGQCFMRTWGDIHRKIGLSVKELAKNEAELVGVKYYDIAQRLADLAPHVNKDIVNIKCSRSGPYCLPLSKEYLSLAAKQQSWK